MMLQAETIGDRKVPVTYEINDDTLTATYLDAAVKGHAVNFPINDHEELYQRFEQFFQAWLDSAAT